jgi:hypothetical protein
MTIHFILKSLRRKGISIPVIKLDAVMGIHKGISVWASAISNKKPMLTPIAV